MPPGSPTANRPGLNRPSAGFRPSLKRPPTGPPKAFVPKPSSASFPPPSVPSSVKSFQRRALRRQAERGAKRRVVQSVKRQASNAIARQSAKTAAAKILGRALGAYGAFSLIADVFELANPFVQDWLRGGWRGSEGFQHSPTFGEPPFKGGQEPRQYVTGGTTTTQNSGVGPWNGSIYGPIGGFRLYDYERFNKPYRKVQAYGRHGSNGNPVGEFMWLDQSGGQYNGSGGNLPYNLTVNDPVAVGSAPDVGGDLPGDATPNPIYGNPSLRTPQEIPTPSTPLVQPLVSIPKLSPSSVPTSSPTQSPYLPSVLNPDAVPSENTQNEPKAGAQISTPELPQYSSKQPRPTKPDSDSCQGQGNSPCQSATFEMLEFLEDLLERPDIEEEEPPDPPKLARVDFPYVRCVEGSAEIFSGSFTYDPLSFPGLGPLLEEQATLAAKGCDDGDSVVAIPDSWQARRPRNIPTLVLVFRSSSNGSYHSYSSPHPKNTDPPEEPPVGNFRKGNHGAIINLSDNSRLHVHSSTESEAIRVITEFKSQVLSSYLDDDAGIRLYVRRGPPVIESEMTPVRAIFYADGNKTLMPVWRKSFTSSL